MPNDIIGHVSLVARGKYNQQWLDSLSVLRKSTPPTTQRVNQVESKPTAERVTQLVEQLGLNTNRLLQHNPKVKPDLIAIIAKYSNVFITDTIKVGKTDRLSMKIVLQDHVVPTQAHVRHIKPQFQQ